MTGRLGQEAAVEQAKNEVLQLFDTQSNRITLKVDIPHEHHFFVIGRKVCLCSRVAHVCMCVRVTLFCISLP